jgi:hypothetical protein
MPIGLFTVFKLQKTEKITNFDDGISEAMEFSKHPLSRVFRYLRTREQPIETRILQFYTNICIETFESTRLLREALKTVPKVARVHLEIRER